MNLNASVTVWFDGDCEAAFKFYERLLDARLEIVLPWGASPLADQAPTHWADKILFARLTTRSMTLLGADALPGSYQAPAGFSLTLRTAALEEAERFFAVLSENGTVKMPLQQTFFALRYGLVIDRFKIPWEINCAAAH